VEQGHPAFASSSLEVCVEMIFLHDKKLSREASKCRGEIFLRENETGRRRACTIAIHATPNRLEAFERRSTSLKV